ncbi:MAG: TraR/DksA family transcriptional regulator [Nannocystaceae bacterium]
MDHLKADQLASLKTALTDARDAIVQGAGARIEETQGPGRDGSGRDTGDRQDAAADEAARGLVLRLAGHEQRKLAEIDAALERMTQGTYGICEDSGDEISLARLSQVPTARRTVDAQEQYEEELQAGDERNASSPY